MNGIHAAFTGRIGNDAEVRTASDGKALGILPRGGGRQDRRARPRRPWVGGALFSDTVGTVAPRLTKGPRFTVRGG